MYRVLNPHVKGLQLTLDQCKPYRYSEGWKLRDKELLGEMCNVKNIGLGRQIRTVTCDCITEVGKGPINSDKTRELKITKENTDKSQGKNESMVYTGI